MNTIAVVGCGLQGSCVAYGLMKLGYTVELVDLDNNILNTAAQKLRLLGCDVFAKHTCYKQLKNAKTLVSCAPYKINEAIHNWCGCNGVKYCDLGGNPEISEKINLNADKDAKYFFSTALLDESYYTIENKLIKTKFGTYPYLIHDNSSFSLNLISKI